MAKTSGKGNPVSQDKPAEAAGGSVDKIRDIIFGQQMQVYEERFAALESNLHNEGDALRKEIRKNFESLEKEVREKYSDLSKRLAEAIDQLKFDKTDRGALAGLFEELSKRLKQMDDE